MTLIIKASLSECSLHVQIHSVWSHDSQCFCVLLFRVLLVKTGYRVTQASEGSRWAHFKIRQITRWDEMSRVLTVLMCWSIDKAVIRCETWWWCSQLFAHFLSSGFSGKDGTSWTCRCGGTSGELTCPKPHSLLYIGHINTITYHFSLIAGFRGTLEKPDQWENEVTQDQQDHPESKVYLVQLEKKGQRSDFHLQTGILTFCGCDSHALQRIASFTWIK